MPEHHYLRDELYKLIKTDDTIFEFLQSAALDGLWYWDLENPEHEWMNAEFWTTLGYDPADMPHRADAWQDIINQDDLQVALNNFNKHLADPKHPYDQLVRYRHKDGSTVWVRCRGLAIRDDSGKPIRMLGAHNDVTKLKEAQQQVAEDATFYKTFHENQSAYFITLNPEGNYTYVNDVYCDDFGWSRDRLLGTSSLYGMVEEDHQAALAVGETCFADPGSHHKARLRKQCNDGSIKISDWEFTALTDEYGQPTELVCIGIDATEQVKAEAALKASEAQFRFIAENTSDGILVFNYDKVIYASPAYMRILGYSLEEEKAHTKENIYGLIHPEDRERIQALVENAISEQKRNFSYEYRAQHKDGHYVWREDRATSLYGDNGIPVSSVLIARDITERKQAEADLQRTTLLLEEAERITNMGAWEYDMATGELIWTNQVYAIHGVPVGTPTSQIDGLSFFHPDDRHIIDTAFRQALEQQMPFDVQCRFITADNNHRWVRTSGHPVVKNAQATRIIGTFQDITEYKSLEERLRTSEQQLQATLASMDDYVFVFDSGGVFRDAHHVNDGYYLPKEQFLGKTYNDVLPAEVAAQFDTVFEQAQHATQTETFLVEYSLEMQGSTRWYSAKATTRFAHNGDYDGLTLVARDITDRKYAEDALAKSEAKFRSFVENANDVIVTVSTQGDYRYVSPQWEKARGISAEKIIGTPFPFAPNVHPEDIHELYGMLETMTTNRVGFEGIVYRVKHGDGTWHWLSSTGAPICDEAGNVTEILVNTRDVTSDKVAEQAMQATLARLEQALSHNNLLMKELHHRVKNNLAIIASLLTLQARGLQDEAAKIALRESRTRIVAMSEIHELMYRHDSSKRIAFHDYLTSLVERMARSFGRTRGIAFNLETPNVKVTFDQAIPLGLIINELLTNAIKYAFPKNYTDADPHVDITVTIEAGLTLMVSDNGVGLKDDMALEESDSLGMTVIYSLTEQLGGHVTFHNRPSDSVGLQATVNVPLASHL
jgi:PAS domain S-box-containing protein